MSINLRDISALMDKNRGQETFVVPSFVMAALHVNASKRSEISLPLLEIEDKPLANLEVNQNNLIFTRISELQSLLETLTSSKREMMTYTAVPEVMLRSSSR